MTRSEEGYGRPTSHRGLGASLSHTILQKAWFELVASEEKNGIIIKEERSPRGRPKCLGTASVNSL